jgi:putative transposase
VACLTEGQDKLLTLFQFPAQHWLHLRTTNPIESPFATVKARTRKTRGAGSRHAALALAYKLALSRDE